MVYGSAYILFLMLCINTEDSITTQMSIIQVLRSVNKSLNNQTPKCEYLQKWLYHINTYSKVALTSTKLLVKLTPALDFGVGELLSGCLGAFEYFIRQLFFLMWRKAVPFSCTKFGSSYKGSNILTMFLKGKYCTLKENPTDEKRDPNLSHWLFKRENNIQKGTRFHHIYFLKGKLYYEKKDPVSSHLFFEVKTLL